MHCVNAEACLHFKHHIKKMSLLLGATRVPPGVMQIHHTSMLHCAVKSGDSDKGMSTYTKFDEEYSYPACCSEYPCACILLHFAPLSTCKTCIASDLNTESFK